MGTNEVERALKGYRCEYLRQKGSHRRWKCPCGEHFTTVPAKKKRIGIGLLQAIQRQVACLGPDWLGV